jgi:beta-glucosidase
MSILHCLVTSIASLLASGATAAIAADGRPPSLKSFDDQANQWLAKMSLAEKIGQMTQAETSSLGDLADIADLSLGSVLCGGGSDPKDGNGLAPWTALYEACQQKALESRLKIPLLFGVDAMHGHSNLVGAVIFPHNVGLGCTRDAALLEEIGRVTALEVRASGINWAFAPCVAAPQDDRWGRTYEGFSEDPTICGELGAALVRGLQGDSLADPLRVLACAKHFVGDGGTTAEMRPPREGGGPPQLALDQGDVQVDEATLRRLHLAPYRPAIDAGVASVMVSYSSWNGVKCTANKQLLTDVLKGELGFDGLVISDYNAIAQTDPDFKTAIKKSINAGIDMAMEPNRYRDFITHLTALVEAGEVPMARIDDAVRRILRVKAAMGLLGPQPNVAADDGAQQAFGSAEHRALARQAVRESLVLLKNEGAVLPLAKTGQRILVAGRGADDIGIQCGGWTVDWQGKAGDVTTGGTTLLAAIKKVAGAAGVTFSADGAGATDADVGVVVVGEEPYAEFRGDDADLALSDEDRAVVRRVQDAGIPVVLVLVSGRPMILGDVGRQSDAIVAAWLPGTEGDGVADVLFGDYAPTGRLAYTWPSSADQHPLNIGDTDDKPLYEFGYGLSYPK